MRLRGSTCQRLPKQQHVKRSAAGISEHESKLRSVGILPSQLVLVLRDDDPALCMSEGSELSELIVCVLLAPVETRT